MSSTESPISFTTKVAGDLFTVRGNTPAEFKQRVEAVLNDGVLDVAGALAEAAHGFAPAVPNASPGATQVIAAAFPGATQVAPEPAAAPAPKQAAYAGQPPVCNHGPMEFVSKVSPKTNKPYRAWFCSAPQGTPQDQKCPAQFIH